MTVTCPSCGKALEASDSMAGREALCPYCATVMLVPGPEVVAADRPAADRPGGLPAEACQSRRAAGSRDEPSGPAVQQRRPCPVCGELIMAAAAKCRYCSAAVQPVRSLGPAAAIALKPGKVTAVGVMMVVGGSLALLGATIMALTCFLLLWPGTYYALVMGIMAIVKGARLLAADAHRHLPPKGTAIMQIINIINFDLVNVVLGVVNLVFLSDQEVRSYLRGY